MLTAAQLAFMRAQMALIRPNLCTIKMPVRSIDGAGATTSYNSVASNVPCRLGPFTPRTPEEEFIAGQFLGQILVTITLPYNQPFQNDYLITISGGQTYHIVGKASEHGEWALSLRLICRKIGQED